MWKGEIVVAQIAPEAGAPMTPVAEAEAVAGKGIAGDRYFKGIGFFSHKTGARRQVTLFESEVLATILRDHNVEVSPSECRMNLITRNVPLSHLVGHRFRVGSVTLRGLKLNEPCQRLQDVIGRRVIPALVHRCGLNAEILEGGIIRPGDAVVPVAGTD